MPVVVDLSGAAFVDSSILGAVLDARRRGARAGLGFAVALTDGAQPVRARARGHRPRLNPPCPLHTGRGDRRGAAGSGPTGEHRPGLHLTVAARPENLAVVRQALAGFADAIGFDRDAISDLKTIVTEACMNVVVHAYPEDEPGRSRSAPSRATTGSSLAFAIRAPASAPARPSARTPGLRLGLPLIATLSDEFEIRGGQRGTEVRMVLELLDATAPRSAGPPSVPDPETSRGDGDVDRRRHLRPARARARDQRARRARRLLGRPALRHDPDRRRRLRPRRDPTSRRHGRIEIVDAEGRLDVRIGPLVEGAASTDPRRARAAGRHVAAQARQRCDGQRASSRTGGRPRRVPRRPHRHR